MSGPEAGEVPDEERAPSGLAHLWAGWRSAGFSSSASGMSAPPVVGCVFCRIVDSPEPAADKLVLHHDDRVMVLMNLYPYTSGHLMVIPTAHIGRLADLPPETSTAIWDMIRRADVAVRRTFHPDGTNIGINQGRAAGASIPDHLHVHIVPRWSNDTNFMTAVADTRVMIETVQRSYERLSAKWE
jgi:ATP adenylyltransferase